MKECKEVEKGELCEARARARPRWSDAPVCALCASETHETGECALAPWKPREVPQPAALDVSAFAA